MSLRPALIWESDKTLLVHAPHRLGDALEAPTSADVLECADVAAATAAAAIGVRAPGQQLLKGVTWCRVPCGSVVIVAPTINCLTRKFINIIHPCLSI